MNKLFVVLALMVGSAQAAPVTIDFSDPALPDNGDQAGFATQGFDFSFGPDPIPNPQAFFTTGERLVFCPGCDVYMENSSGLPFDLISFEVRTFPQPDDIVINVTGFLADGGTLSDTLPINGEVQLVELNWTGLSRVEFDPSASAAQGPFPTEIDTIVVDVVPIPAAAWLFGSALVGLGWMRRRRVA